MRNRDDRNWGRREFLAKLGLASGAASARTQSDVLRRSRRRKQRQSNWSKAPPLCLAPQFPAEELLAGEGFTDVQS